MNITYVDDMGSACNNMFGSLSTATTDYMRERVNTFADIVGQGAGKAFGCIKDTFERTHGVLADLSRKKFQNKLAGSWQHDGVQRYSELQHFQTPNAQMPRWIMANPSLMRKHEMGVVECWDGDFEVKHEGVGKDNYLYRRATNGVEVDGVITNYFEPLESADDKLSFADQCSVMRSWDNADKFIDEDIDPTSIWDSTF